MRHRPNRRLLKLRQRAELKQQFSEMVHRAREGDIEYFRQLDQKLHWGWYVFCPEHMRGVEL